MEVKINKEIREFSESIFFGLSLRQFIFSILACGVAIVLYFTLKPFFGIETLSWLCILGAAPFAALGFIKYNGMNAEEFVIAFLKNIVMMPKHLIFDAQNIYAEEFREVIDERMKQGILKPKKIIKEKKDKKLKKGSKKNKEAERNVENT